MIGQDIYESMEYIDNSNLESAQRILCEKNAQIVPIKRKRVRVIKGVSAALLALTIPGVLYTRFYQEKNRATQVDQSVRSEWKQESESEEENLNDNAAIYFAGKVYRLSSKTPVTKLADGFSYIGEIQNQVEESQQPSHELETNGNLVGDTVYQYKEQLAVQAGDTDMYWLFQLQDDLVYRTYDTGFDVDCQDGEAVTVCWSVEKDDLVRVYLYDCNSNTLREATEEERSNQCMVVTKRGHYVLYGVDGEGNSIDMTSYLENESTTYLEGENGDLVEPLNQ